MKKFFKVTLALVILGSSVNMLTSCSDSDPVPTDVITDESGIKIDLDWSVTGGTSADALEKTDLDLIVYKNGSAYNSSESTNTFERIEMDPADGTYVVKVLLFRTSANVSYTVTANGQTVSKPITFTSTFASTDDDLEVETLTIVKSGSKYTVTQ